MKLDNAILYMPCPCGSGAKFKFCCRPKLLGELDGCRTRADIVAEVRCRQAGAFVARENPEVAELCDKGFDALPKGKFDDAREFFRRARELDSGALEAWNNGAICEWESGEVEAAIDLQRKSFEHLPFRNTFGTASMAIYLHVLGREEEAAEWLEKALKDRLPLSRDVVARVCFALALYRRHRDIVDYAVASCMDDDPLVALFKGVALANLGAWERALPALESAVGEDPTGLAEHYVDCFEEGVETRSVREGEWPYLSYEAFAPARWFNKAMEDGRDPFERYPAVAAEAMEVLANDDRQPAGKLLALIRGREGEPWETLRKGLERLAEEDAQTEAPGRITEMKDEARRLFRQDVPKWRMEMELPEDSSPENDAEHLLETFVRPYCDRYCSLAVEGRDADLLAILVAHVESRPELSDCPTVTLVSHAQLWDAFCDELVDFFDNASSGPCWCEVRCDPMFGGPYLTLKTGNFTTSFMVAIADRHGENADGIP